jgi:hypothetical protein
MVSLKTSTIGKQLSSLLNIKRGMFIVVVVVVVVVVVDTDVITTFIQFLLHLFLFWKPDQWFHCAASTGKESKQLVVWAEKGLT